MPRGNNLFLPGIRLQKALNADKMAPAEFPQKNGTLQDLRSLSKMKTMIYGIVKGRSLGPVVSVAALLYVAAFAGAAPARAQEDTNMFNSVLGFVGMQFDKEQDTIDYRARPPIVVPPKTDLPPPKVAVRDPSWPKDPDVIAERRAALEFPPARPTNNAQYAGRNVADGVTARARPPACGRTARRMSSWRWDAYMPLCSLESSEVHGCRLLVGYGTAGARAAA